MATQLHTLAHSVALIVILLCAVPAHAQSEDGAAPDQSEDGAAPDQSGEEAATDQTGNRPFALRMLLGTEAILHSADMVTSVRALRLGGNNVREANLLLRPFARRPVVLAAVSSGLNVLQVYTISKLERRHPKIAKTWAVILIAAEAYAVTNNIMVARRLKHSGTR